MKLKDKIKCYSFWISLASAIILILKILGTRFGFSIDESMVSDLFTALCSILVLLGIIVVPTNIPNQTQKTNTAHNEENNLYSNKEDQAIDKNQISNNKQSHQEQPVNENKKENLTIENNSNILNENSEQKTISLLETPQTTNTTEEIYIEENLHKEILDESPEVSTELNINNTSFFNNETTKQNSLKDIFDCQRGRFSNNIDTYIFELQEEIRRVREGTQQ